MKACISSRLECCCMADPISPQATPLAHVHKGVIRFWKGVASLSASSFQYAQTGRPDLFYPMNDVSVYRGRQRREVVTYQKNTFHTCVLHSEQRAVSFPPWIFRTPALGQMLQERLPTSSFGQCPLSWKNGLGLPPPFLHTVSNQKLEGGRLGNEARIDIYVTADFNFWPVFEPDYKLVGQI